MAISGTLSERMQVFTFSSAVSPPVLTTAQQVTKLIPGDDSPDGDGAPTQFLAFRALFSNGSSDTATVVVLVVDDNSVGSLGLGKYRQVTLTIASSTTRSSHNTGAGEYVGTITSSESPGNCIVDVFGDVGKDANTFPKIYVACTALSAGTLTLGCIPGRRI